MSRTKEPLVTTQSPPHTKPGGRFQWGAAGNKHLIAVLVTSKGRRGSKCSSSLALGTAYAVATSTVGVNPGEYCSILHWSSCISSRNNKQNTLDNAMRFSSTAHELHQAVRFTVYRQQGIQVIWMSWSAVLHPHLRVPFSQFYLLCTQYLELTPYRLLWVLEFLLGVAHVQMLCSIWHYITSHIMSPKGCPV